MVAESMAVAAIPHLRVIGSVLTASISATTEPENAADAEMLIAQADAALHAAKKAWRNRAVHAVGRVTALRQA